MARRVTPRMAGFRPGTSPPPVRIPIAPFLVLTLAMRRRIALSWDAEQKIMLHGRVFRKSEGGIRLLGTMDSKIDLEITARFLCPWPPGTPQVKRRAQGRRGAATGSHSRLRGVLGDFHTC